MKNIGDILDEYVSSAIAHYEAVVSGDSKKANKEFDKNHKSFKELKSLFGSKGLEKLAELFEYPHDAVRVAAATHHLPVDSDRAKMVLNYIVIYGNQHNSFTAKMVLSEWKIGRLKIDF